MSAFALHSARMAVDSNIHGNLQNNEMGGEQTDWPLEKVTWWLEENGWGGSVARTFRGSCFPLCACVCAPTDSGMPIQN